MTYSVNLIYGLHEGFLDSWDILKDEDFFSDIDNISSAEDFKRFYDESVIDVCVAYHKEKIIAGSYIINGGYKAFAFSGFVRKGFRDSKISLMYARKALEYFFNKYDVNRIDVFGKNNDRESRLISQRLGFKKVGIIKKFLPHNNIIEDFYMSSILKEEF